MKTSGTTPSTGGDTSGGSFWPGPYVGGTMNPPAPADTSHVPGAPCMSCHVSEVTSALGKLLVYGGTVYGADGATPAAGVEVGVSYGGQVLVTVSDANGNFGVIGTPMAEGAHPVRMRYAAGVEKIKAATEVSKAECNECHQVGGTATPLVSP